MSKPAERRHRSKLHYLARGRADALVAIAADLGWVESFTIAIGRRIGVDHGDYCEALARANAYTEASNPS